METKLINWGIASRVDNTVYLNKRLNRYPKLKSALISHERAHTDGLTMKDVVMDLDVKELKGLKSEYYKFLFSNPTAWVEFSPIKKYEKDWLFNLPVALVWAFFGIIIWFILTNLM